MSVWAATREGALRLKPEMQKGGQAIFQCGKAGQGSCNMCNMRALVGKDIRQFSLTWTQAERSAWMSTYRPMVTALRGEIWERNGFLPTTSCTV